MTAATTSSITLSRVGVLIPILLAADALALEGALCFVDADGYASSDAATNSIVAGVWDGNADNTGGDDGATYALVKRGCQFLLLNDTADPVTQADLGTHVWAVDNQTVSNSDAAGTRSIVGRFMGFDHDQPSLVWVEIT